MRKLTVILLVLAAAACTRGKPVYNVDDALPPAAQNLSLERIEQLIIEAGSIRDWKMSRAEPGHLVAIQEAPKHRAVIDIYVDQRRYRIVKGQTIGLRDRDGTIHDHYNLWIRNLEHDINTRLSNAAAT